jgi:hypothetical protein
MGTIWRDTGWSVLQPSLQGQRLLSFVDPAHLSLSLLAKISSCALSTLNPQVPHYPPTLLLAQSPFMNLSPPIVRTLYELGVLNKLTPFQSSQ